MKFCNWVKLMFEWMGSYSHDEDGANDLQTILQLRKENVELAEHNLVLSRMADALREDLFDAGNPVHADFDALQLRFSSFFLNCNLEAHLHPEEVIFIKRTWMQAISAAYQLGKVHRERSAK